LKAWLLSSSGVAVFLASPRIVNIHQREEECRANITVKKLGRIIVRLTVEGPPQHEHEYELQMHGIRLNEDGEGI
jgi:hypothetical protein